MPLGKKRKRNYEGFLFLNAKKDVYFKPFLLINFFKVFGIVVAIKKASANGG